MCKYLLLFCAFFLFSAVEAKPNFFKIGSERFRPNVKNSTYHNGNDLTVLMNSSEQDPDFNPGVIQTSICYIRLEFIDLYDQVKTGDVFDLT